MIIDARMVGPVPHGIANYVSHLASGLSKLTLPYRPVFLVSSVRKEFFGFETVRAESDFLSLDELREIPRILREKSPLSIIVRAFRVFLHMDHLRLLVLGL